MIKNGPWTIKASEEKYKNPWIRVQEDKVIRPDGKDGIFGIVEMVSGISVLPLDEEGFVYLTDEFHYGLQQNSIEVVSGAIDNDEKPIEAAKRELKEELGIEAENWVDFGLINPFTTVVKSPATLFLARKLKFSHANPEGTEKINSIKIKLDEAVRMVMESTITHAPSAVLILKVSLFLNKK